MNKIIIPILLSLILNFLQASDTIFISPKVALKMIDKKNITFIALDKASLKIKGSNHIDINLLESSDILGRTRCAPFYVCPDILEKYFSKLGIESSDELIIYDNSYGIHSATLYVALENMGQKKMHILRGGLNNIAALDLNWKIYNNYLDELKIEDANKSSFDKSSSKISNLRKKINLLKSHLLLQDANDTKTKTSDYQINGRRSKYLLSKKELKEAVVRVRANMSSIHIVDACEMIDIVGSTNGSYVAGVGSLSWKKLINKKQKNLKSNEELEELLSRLEFKKSDNYYLYCMSGEEKAFFVMMVLRELGYDKVKTFTGDWNTWVGDMNE